jgi:hypothetical protein
MKINNFFKECSVLGYFTLYPKNYFYFSLKFDTFSILKIYTIKFFNVVKSLTSSLSTLLCKSDHEFIVKNNIDPDAPINVPSRHCFQNICL